MTITKKITTKYTLTVDPLEARDGITDYGEAWLGDDSFGKTFVTIRHKSQTVMFPLSLFEELLDRVRADRALEQKTLEQKANPQVTVTSAGSYPAWSWYKPATPKLKPKPYPRGEWDR